MLQFFTRHQRVIFIFTTFIIVISFSFFGVSPHETTGPNPGDRVIGETLTGRSITRGEVEEMLQFIASDRLDKAILASPDNNFLNDGVIRKDFLETGLASLLAEKYFPLLSQELDQRQKQERHYEPYSHPQAWFLSAGSIWNAYAPELATAFVEFLRFTREAPTLEAFNARVRVYLEERSFPQNNLQYLLRQQERQYDWVRHDPNMDQTDMALFNHHSLQDWFGNHFLHLVSQTIIQGAAIAESKGYSVSDAEALADLRRNTELSFREMLEYPGFNYSNSGDYLVQHLRIMGLSDQRAVDIWKQVLLFRRYYNDVGASVFMDALSFEQFENFAKEAAKLDIYELPSLLRLTDYSDLQEFETYLSLVSDKDEDSIEIPARFLPLAEVEKRAPRLVQRRFKVKLAEVDRAGLQGKVSLRAMWDWETSDTNWRTLTDKFAALAVKSANSKDQRIDAIDTLDEMTRSQVHSFARDQIVSMHPEWLEEALKEAPAKEALLSLRAAGGTPYIKGLKSTSKLADLLDRSTENDPQVKERLAAFTADDRHFYRIELIETLGSLEVMSFADVRQDGTIAEITMQRLEAQYQEIRGSDPVSFRNEKGEWRALSEVRDQVADSLFSNLIQAVTHDVQNREPGLPIPSENVGAFAAKHRFDAHVHRLGQLLKEQQMDKVLVGETSSIEKQWGLQKREYVARRDQEAELRMDRILAMSTGEWSSLQYLSGGNVAVFQYIEDVDVEKRPDKQVFSAQRNLANEAKQAVFKKQLDEMNLSTKYLSTIEEEA